MLFISFFFVIALNLQHWMDHAAQSNTPLAI
jgi:hypothetical protein